MFDYDMAVAGWLLREDEIEAIVGRCGAAIDDPQTDPAAWLGGLPSDTLEWAAPPPEAS